MEGMLHPDIMRYKLVRMLGMEGVLNPYAIASVVQTVGDAYEQDWARCVNTCYDLECDTKRFQQEEDPMTDAITVREAARKRNPLSGADAQALEGALSQTERELTALREERDGLRKLLVKVRPYLIGIPILIDIQAALGQEDAGARVGSKYE